MNTITKCIICGVAGATVGAGVAYIVTKKTLGKKFDAALDRTIDSMSKEYDQKLAKINKTLDSDIENMETPSVSACSSVTPAVPSKVEDSEKSTNGSEAGTDDSDPPLGVISKKDRISYHKIATEENYILDDEFEEDEYEVTQRNIIKKEVPYLVRVAEYNGNTMDYKPWYEFKSLRLFMKDWIELDGDKLSIPILYDADSDMVFDIVCDEELGARLRKMGFAFTGDIVREKLDTEWETEFGNCLYDSTSDSPGGYDYDEDEVVVCNDREECYYHIVKEDVYYKTEILQYDEDYKGMAAYKYLFDNDEGV